MRQLPLNTFNSPLTRGFPKRHASPWNVILRNTLLPILVLAFRSRLWLGGYAVIIVVIDLL